jgi:Zn-dependent protease with chaperone function
VQVSERIGNTPYRLRFPGGGLAVTADHAGVEAAFQLAPSQHWLARMEQASWFVAAALVGLAAALYFAWQALIPLAADAVAQRIPRDAEKALGTGALKGMDRWLFKTSKLESSELSAVRTVFDELAARAGLTDAVELQFRDMVPNALALPGGTVIVTDGLVQLFKADPRLLAGVIAHELGHIQHRHSLRHLLAGSASALIVGALMGDVSGVSALATSAPLLLTTLHYTREAEVEADRYAFDLLKKAGRSPKDFADSMRRLEVMELCVALRQKLLTGKFGRAWGGGGADETETQADKDSREKELQSVPNCSSDPDTAIKGHESEIADLRNEDRETGYMHTHPVTQERIRAAEAAAGAAN